MLKIIYCLVALASLSSFKLTASHLLGAEITYKIIGPDLYEFTVYYYRDCRVPSQGGGNPNALAEDSPLYITTFHWNYFFRADSIESVENVYLPLLNPSNCYSPLQPPCINRIKFVFQLNLPHSILEYTILNQRCCMSDGITNIINSGSLTNSFYCKIPPASLGSNSSAVFSPLTNTLLSVNKEYSIDFSAIDPDNDSLSYELCTVDLGGDAYNNPKPFILSGGLPTLLHPVYTNSYTSSLPMSGISLDAKTGKLDIKTNTQGSYVVSVCCHEWRNGIIINTVKRIYTFTVQNINFSALDVRAYGDTIVLKESIVNLSATGAETYHWDYAPKFSSNKIAFSDIQNPIVDLNLIGAYNFYVTGTNSEGCFGMDSAELVFTNEKSVFVPNAFSPNNDGVNDRVKIIMSGYDLVYFKIYNRRGQEVFYTNDVNIEWDGRFKGGELGIDTYYWVASAIDLNDKIQIFKGDITLIR
ncbi:MAG TPA: gliding motility-associated C-terminal domain-containing protein [Chitinophagaceae bacterium]|nr:gliding motility-associated C-terminal domain-containing protein [Chitinophagaceae bacterium]